MKESLEDVTLNALFKVGRAKTLYAEDILTSQRHSDMDDNEAAVYDGLCNEDESSGYSTLSSQREEEYLSYLATIEGAANVAKENANKIPGLLFSHGKKETATASTTADESKDH